nr:PAS domain S-box protein [Anaerolineae bacterium]
MARVASYERDFQTGKGYWSDEQYRLFGYEPGQVPSSHELFKKHVHPDDRAMVTEAIEEGLAEGKGFELDCRYIPRDGEVRYAHIICNVGLDDAGKPRWMHGTFQDITERMQVEEALRQSEEKYRDLVEEVNDVIYAIDTNGVITYVNPAIESFLGYSPSEVIGRTFGQF